ncbi:regulatory protein RecX [Sphingorhabdus sp. M41]|uniref:regulatory protein RecX n=1 Tax=Sphingorhabdus sp. M41 TaxID=1806885 RepID=UPI0009EEC803|nr:regulatory protein RecX [Sphingorhabdus sp. M41]
MTSLLTAFTAVIDYLWRLNFDPTVAQKGQTSQLKVKPLKNSVKTLDQESLHRLAIRYVERYATSRKKLADYLHRKIREREWDDAAPPAVDQLVERFAERGYIDDALYAQNKASALTRRGYGARRVEHALYQAGISEADGREAFEASESNKWAAADKFARKRRIGPYAEAQQADDKCRKQLQAFLRAGHDLDLASRFVFAKPGEEIAAEE